jgi:hypothetical protein
MEPIRFIHTSDIHLDTSFTGAGFPSRLGARKREAIRGTFRRILEDARKQAVSLVLIPGDLFEYDHVTPDTIEFLKQQFESLAPIPVFIAPGNHDPCLQDSPYCVEAWPANVHIFREEEFRSIELPDAGVRVTGYGFTRPQLQEPLFQKLPVLPEGAWNLVLAHGSDLSGESRLMVHSTSTKSRERTCSTAPLATTISSGPCRTRLTRPRSGTPAYPKGGRGTKKEPAVTCSEKLPTAWFP